MAGPVLDLLPQYAREKNSLQGVGSRDCDLKNPKNERQHYLQELKVRRHLLCLSIFSIIPQVKIHAKYNIGGSRLCYNPGNYEEIFWQLNSIQVRIIEDEDL